MSDPIAPASVLLASSSTGPAASWLAPLPGLIVLLLCGGALFYAVLSMYIGWRMLHPPRRSYASAVARNQPGDPGELSPPLENEPWQADTSRGAIDLWDCAGENADGPVVVFTHGWSDSRIQSLVRMHALSPHASRMIAWDLPGHGDAIGRFTLGAREPELLAELAESVAERHTGRPLVLYGWSLGSGISIAAAHRLQHAGKPIVSHVIAEAPYRDPFTPARRALIEGGLPHRVVLRIALRVIGVFSGVGQRWRGFERAALAAEMDVPLLVIHGTADRICPYEHGVVIATSAPRGELLTIEGAEHRTLWTDERHRTEVLAACARVLRDASTGRKNQPQAALPSIP